MAGRNKRGYGVFNVLGSQYLSHRMAFEMEFGEIDKGLFCCHKCDVPTCVRADHMFIGTADDNAKDMIKKGRSAAGDRSSSRLHPERVARGDGHGSRLHPERVARGDRHGTKTHPERITRGEDHYLAKLDSEKVKTIRAMYSNGYKISKIVRKLGIGRGAIKGVTQGRTWRHVT
jgi:hypothetical protein